MAEYFFELLTEEIPAWMHDAAHGRDEVDEGTRHLHQHACAQFTAAELLDATLQALQPRGDAAHARGR